MAKGSHLVRQGDSFRPPPRRRRRLHPHRLRQIGHPNDISTGE